MPIKITQTSTDITLLGHKDAFHVPGVICKCKTMLVPGDYVRFVFNDPTSVELVTGDNEYHGIVSPFIPDEIHPGVLFYVLVHPDMSKNLRHDFTIDVEDFVTHRVYSEDERSIDLAMSEIESDGCSGCYS